MNEVLKNREQINMSTQWLKDNGYVSHPISCKDWELCMVTQNLKDGDLMDAGADGSFVLHNAIKKGIKGRKVGIDLMEVGGDNAAEGAEYFKGDLQRTNFDNNSFDTITSCSVLEHQVNFDDFAKEMSRLLRRGGDLYVSCDFWPEKIDTSLTKLYSLDWNILSKQEAENFIDTCARYGLVISDVVDYTTEDAVINPSYCSPAQCSYSFLILHFIKKYVIVD